MNKLMRVILTTTAVTVLVATLGAQQAFAKNNKHSAEGKKDWRTWVVYHSGSQPDHAPHFQVGDAFRLSMDKDKKFRFKPLRKMSRRWDIPDESQYELKAKPGTYPESENVMCGSIDVSLGGVQHEMHLLIQSIEDNLLNIYWVGEECSISQHPGHAKAEN